MRLLGACVLVGILTLPVWAGHTEDWGSVTWELGHSYSLLSPGYTGNRIIPDGGLTVDPAGALEFDLRRNGTEVTVWGTCLKVGKVRLTVKFTKPSDETVHTAILNITCYEVQEH